MPFEVVMRNAAAVGLSDAVAGGVLRLRTAGGITLANLAIPNPITVSPASGGRSVSVTGTAIASGDAEQAQLRTSSDQLGWERTDAAAVSALGGGGAVELQQASTAIVSGQTISATINFSIPAGT